MPYVTNGDCTIFHESFGPSDSPTLLMVNGLGSQCINYKDEWCEMFVARGFHVIRTFVGHGIGRRMHEEPQVHNFGRRGRGLELREGMVLAIEPMLCEIGSKLRSRIDRAGGSPCNPK